jgi:tetratricopeptide (TPR) repeat protein
MYSGRTKTLRAILLIAAVSAVLWTTATWSQDALKPVVKEAESSDKELEPAVAKAREGRVDEALGVIKEKAAKHPEWPPDQVILARVLFSVNQVVAGRRALEQAAAQAGDHPDVYLTLGGTALGDGRFSDALLNFEKVLSLTAASRWGAEKTKVFRREALAGLAAVAETREDWKSTQEHLTGWLELEPKNGQIRQRLGRALFRLGKIDDAFAAFKQAVLDTPVLEPAAVSMAWLYGQKGDPKKAEEWFDYAQKFEPKSARVRLAHSKWLLDLGRPTDARAEIDEALKLDPGLKDAQRLQALVTWHLRDLAGAQATLEPLHRDAPADSFVANLLALTLIEQDDKAKQSRGLQLADVNAQQFPGLPEIQATHGWALYRAGRLDPAEQKLRAAVTGVRTTPDIVYFLARVFADTGHADDARKLLQSATNSAGAFAHRRDAEALLKSLTK